MDNTKNTTTNTSTITKETDSNKQTSQDDDTHFSFSIDNSLEEIYITPSNLRKNEKNDADEASKIDNQKEAEEIKYFFTFC